MEDYICIYASGSSARGIADKMMESNLALRVEIIKFAMPLYRKNGKVKLGLEDYSVMVIVERSRLSEAMDAFQSMNESKEPVTAFAVPVLAAMGIF